MSKQNHSHLSSNLFVCCCFCFFYVQVDALVQLVKHFSWTWVGVIAGDDAYGHGGANIFAEKVDNNDIFVIFSVGNVITHQSKLS